MALILVEVNNLLRECTHDTACVRHLRIDYAETFNCERDDAKERESTGEV